MARVNIVRINYRAMGSVYTDLMAGQVQIAFGSAPGVMPLVKAGRLRGLAVSSGKPSALAPGLPTIAATGLPGYDFTSPFGIFAPAETPPALVVRLNEEIRRVLAKPDVKERFFKAGMETVGSTPEELATLVKTEMQTLGSIVKEQGS
jgi:tripartite-type tricarboxylate transporter receptor subunit TctC